MAQSRATVLQRLDEATAKCNKCGFCQAGCPTYKVTGIEWTVARGRVALLREVMSGRLEVGDDIREPVFNCLTCGGCTDHCPPGVDTASIITQAREEMAMREGVPKFQQLIFSGLLPRSALLSIGARLVWLGQVTGAESLARNSGILKLLGLSDAAEILPKVPRRTGRALANAVQKPVTERKYRVAYFLGCGTNNVFPRAAAALVRVLQRNGVEVMVPDVVCCGKPPVAYGDGEAARELARRNIDLLVDLDVDAIVTDCATCGSFLREYPELLPEGTAYHEKAVQLAGKTRDVLEFLSEVGLDETGMRRVNFKVTYHDPCHLGRFQKVSKQPRQLLQAIPGLDYVEMNEANMCCGGAGSYGLTHHEISMAVLDRKMGNAARTGATVLATACPGCAMQLSTGVKRSGNNLKVRHVIELLDYAYKPY